MITALGPGRRARHRATLRRSVLDVLAAPAARARAPREPRRRAGALRLGAAAPAQAQRPLAEAILREADLLGVTAAGGLTGYDAHPAGRRRPPAAEHALDHRPARAGRPLPRAARPHRRGARAARARARRASSAWSPTSSRPAGPASTASPRRRSAGRWTPAAPATSWRPSSRSRSRTPLPQALTYLIDDVARRHGVLRAGHRARLPALRRRVAADPGAGRPRRPPGSGCAASPRPSSISAAPVDRGARRAARGRVRAGGRDRPTARSSRCGADAAARRRCGRRLAASPRGPAAATRSWPSWCAGIRSGDALAEHRTAASRPSRAQIPGVTSATTMGLLRGAIREARVVWLGLRRRRRHRRRRTHAADLDGRRHVARARARPVRARGLPAAPHHRDQRRWTRTGRRTSRRGAGARLGRPELRGHDGPGSRLVPGRQWSGDRRTPDRPVRQDPAARGRPPAGGRGPRPRSPRSPSSSAPPSTSTPTG